MDAFSPHGPILTLEDTHAATKDPHQHMDHHRFHSRRAAYDQAAKNKRRCRTSAWREMRGSKEYELFSLREDSAQTN
jgi:hypothetical protein